MGDPLRRKHPSIIDEGLEASVAGAYLSRQREFERKNGRIGAVFGDDFISHKLNESAI